MIWAGNSLNERTFEIHVIINTLLVFILRWNCTVSFQIYFTLEPPFHSKYIIRWNQRFIPNILYVGTNVSFRKVLRLESPFHFEFNLRWNHCFNPNIFYVGTTVSFRIYFTLEQSFHSEYILRWNHRFIPNIFYVGTAPFHSEYSFRFVIVNRELIKLKFMNV